MTPQTDLTQSNQLLEALLHSGDEGVKQALELLLNEAMKLERQHYLQAAPYERTPSRTDQANGYKPRRLQSPLGMLNLSVPQVRSGEFHSQVLEQGLLSERALKVTLAEMYVKGISTRRVAEVMEQLCGLNVSSADVSRATQRLDAILKDWEQRPLGRFPYLYLDARYERVREGGIVIDCAVLIAVGVNEQGQRQVLGVSVALSEHELHWRDFLLSLQKRGLHGVKLIVSDAHSGLKAARKTVFPSVPWQRCQFHLQQNVQAYVKARSKQQEVAEVLRGVFHAMDKEEAHRQLDKAIAQFKPTLPRLAQWLPEAIPEGLTVMHFPINHRVRLRTSNVVERLNREILRRTRLVGVFPNTASCWRLVSAIVMEISERWEGGYRYMKIPDSTELSAQ